jgi:hypothetical protein
MSPLSLLRASAQPISAAVEGGAFLLVACCSRAERERERERDQIVPTGSVCLSCEISDGGTNGEFDEECFDRRIKRFFDTMNQQKKIVRLSSSTRVSTVQDVDA